MAASDADAEVRQPALRPEPYMGAFRRFRVKGDDAWTLAIQWGGALAIILFTLFLVLGCYFHLPTPVKGVDAGYHRYSEQRARMHVDAITTSVGARPYGSVANRVQIRDYILGELTRIQAESSAAGHNRISFRVRNHHGETPKDFHGNDWQQVWESMGNIVVHVAAATAGKSALLVSGHYDSVFLSKGASDNTAGIASMLEMIEVLAYDAPSTHELIFAFVNGEEFGLLGSADLSRFDSEFLKVALFINIDGTPGAKQLNLRTTGGWMDILYGVVPRPLGFVAAADIFNSGWVDSDTDFSVYSEKIPGIDLVTFSHRQTYHTIKDVKLEDGFLQFQGDNMLALIRRIVTLNVSGDSLSGLTSDDTKHVYFSFLNSGYAVYTLTTNYVVFVMLIIGYLLIYGVIMVHRYLYWKDTAMSSTSHPILCLLVGAGFVFCTFLISFGTVSLFALLSAITIPMFSYTSPAMAVFAFFPMAMMAIYAPQWVLRRIERRWSDTLEVSRHRLLWGTGFCWWWLLIFASGASKRSGSTYLLFFFAFFHLVAVVLHHVFFFFGTLTEKPDSDMFETMENAEIKEDEEDKQQYDETGEVRRRPVRPIEHQRWKAAFSKPDIAWFLIFLIATLPPMLFFLDVMVPLIQLAATDMAAWVAAPLIAVVIFLMNVNFLPLSRRGHHYGVIAFLLLIITIFTFIPIWIGGAGSFTARAPYQLVPHQVGDVLTFEPEHPYTYSLKFLCQTIAPDHVWTCKTGTASCSAPGFPAPPIPTSVAIFPPHGYQYAAKINSTNAWIHTITFPLGTEDVLLNGIVTTVDPANATVTFLLSSYEATSSWTIEYNGPYGLVYIKSYWDDLSSAPSMPAIIAKLPDWATIKGRGSWLMSQVYSVTTA